MKNIINKNISEESNIKLSVEEVINNVLTQRQADILKARYGITPNKKAQTLESIGKSYSITRERIRQIEGSSYNAIINSDEYKKLKPTIKSVANFILKNGGVVTEEQFISSLHYKENSNYLLLLLAIGSDFHKIKENNIYNASWTVDSSYINDIKKILDGLEKYIEDKNSLLDKKELVRVAKRKNPKVKSINEDSIDQIISVSKKIKKSPFGLYGIASWRSVSPKGIRDKIVLVFEQNKRPLHFREIANLIDSSSFSYNKKKAHHQTVHNELIKSDKFVLIGRGKYALKEWGYVSGTVKDVIMSVLKEEGNRMHRDEIVEKVFKQRDVKKSTILLNLQDKKTFKTTGDKRYYIA